ncbi:MAG: beta-1,6-N-acetylglucosaminyltransferase [Duganella sp.]
MRIVYLIMAHNNPAHVQRLIERLTAPGASFQVHIDAKADLAPFISLASSSVHFCKHRVSCNWGDISLVKATLQLMRDAVVTHPDADYFVLLSGACYPLQSPDYIASYLQQNRGTEFIEAYALPNLQYGKTLERITHYWIKKGKPLARYRWPLQHWMNRHLPLRNYKKVLEGGEAVTGSQWWCLSGKAVHYVLDYHVRRPALYRFCKFVDCSDEFFFQVILWNSPFRKQISHSLTFTHWVAGHQSPELIDASYLPRFQEPVILDSEQNNCPNEKREVLFARKFSDSSGPVLDQIDLLADRRKYHSVTQN